MVYVGASSAPGRVQVCSWDGWNDATVKLYQISATPSTWLIDRRGVVRYCDVRGAELRKALAVLIAEDGGRL